MVSITATTAHHYHGIYLRITCTTLTHNMHNTHPAHTLHRPCTHLLRAVVDADSVEKEVGGIEGRRDREPRGIEVSVYGGAGAAVVHRASSREEEHGVKHLVDRRPRLVDGAYNGAPRLGKLGECAHYLGWGGGGGGGKGSRGEGEKGGRGRQRMER
jgi:hypothetical protein